MTTPRPVSQPDHEPVYYGSSPVPSCCVFHASRPVSQPAERERHYGTICRCGLARSYHGREGFPSTDEYQPRYSCNVPEHAGVRLFGPVSPPSEPLTADEEMALRADLKDIRPDALAPEERHLMRRVLATLDEARDIAVIARAAPQADEGLRAALDTLRTNLRTDPADRFWEGWDAALMAVEVAVIPGSSRTPATEEPSE